MLLEALVLALQQKGTLAICMSELYEKYAEVASCVGMGLKVVSDKRVADYIWELDKTGITYSKMTSKM